MGRLLRLGALGFVAALAAGCGEGRSPTAPSTPLSRIEIQPEADTLRVGEVAQFTAAAFDTLGQPTATAVGWSSGNTGVFTVSSLGQVRGVGEGTAPLVAQAGGRRDTAWVTVYPDTGWFVQPSGTTATLHGVFFLSDGRTGWAVGAAGTIVRTLDTGASWRRLESGTSFSLNAVWFTTASEGWAVGNGGTVLRTVNGGSSWTRLGNVGVGDALEDVWFSDPERGWIVGANGLALRTEDRGGSWHAQRLPTSFTLHSVSFAGPSDGWAVGAGGVIAGSHDGGRTWFLAPGITTQTLNAVWRRSEPAAFAAGAQGLAPRTVAGPDSTVWELRNAGATRQLEGVCFPSDLVGFAAGWDASLGGAILRSEDAGTTWAAQPSHTAQRLLDVFFVDELRGWAVGEGGVIVHTARGGGR